MLDEQTCAWPFLDLEKSLMLAGAELGDERKIPLKLRRWGDLGGESWWDDSGRGKMVLGVPGLVLGHTGAEDGVQGWLAGGFKHGLADSLLSPWEKTVKIWSFPLQNSVTIQWYEEELLFCNALLKIKVLHDAVLSKWFHKEPLTSEEPQFH